MTPQDTLVVVHTLPSDLPWVHILMFALGLILVVAGASITQAGGRR